MFNFMKEQFEYHFKRSNERKVVRLSLHTIEAGYVKEMEMQGWRVESRYFSAEPIVIDKLLF